MADSTGAQIAAYLTRSRQPLREAHLAPLCYHGFLAFDSDKNNPGVRYKITDKGRSAILTPEWFDIMLPMPLGDETS